MNVLQGKGRKTVNRLIFFFFFACDIAVSLRGTQIGFRLELDDMSNIMENKPLNAEKIGTVHKHDKLNRGDYGADKHEALCGP